MNSHSHPLNKRGFLKQSALLMLGAGVSQQARANQAVTVPLLSSITATSFESTLNSNMERKNLFETIANDKSLKVFRKCIEKTKLDDFLAGEGPFTIFVSNDAAYKKVSFGRKLKVWTNVGLMTDILKFHIIEGHWTTQKLLSVTLLQTLHGESIEVSQLDGQVQVAGIPLLSTDVYATNGVIHIVEQVMLPPETT